jgi:AbrB family looped-hinge helix DNA binding protein
MDVAIARLSSKNQMTLPKEAREALGVRGGDALMVIIADGEVRLQPLPESLTDYLKGLGKEVWIQLGGADAYLKEERGSWL